MNTPPTEAEFGQILTEFSTWPRIRCHLTSREIAALACWSAVIAGCAVFAVVVVRNVLRQFGGDGGTFYPDGGSGGHTDVAHVIQLRPAAADDMRLAA